MSRVYKYTLYPETNKLLIHSDAVFLSVHEQHGKVCMWVLVDTDMPVVEYEFIVAGTGLPLDVPFESLMFLGTALLDRGALVLHVFRVI